MIRRTRFLMLLLTFCLVAGWSSFASAATVNDLTGGVRWGASRQDVEASYRAQLIADYRAAIGGSRDAVRNDRLRREVDDSLKRFSETWVDFTSARTGYESSTIADEIYGGSDLSMMILANADVPKYYIFKGGKLVKVVIATNVATLGFIPFEDFIASLRGPYGRPQDVVTEEDDMGMKHEVRAVWADDVTRLRIENKSSVFNTYLMVLSDAKKPDFSRDTQALSAAGRREAAGGSLDSIFQEVAADTSNRTGDDVVDRIVGTTTQVQVRLRSDARQGDALTSQAVGTTAMDDSDVLVDVDKVERRSSGRRSSDRPASGSSGSSAPSGGGITIY